MPRVIMAEGCQQIDAGGRRHYARGGQAFEDSVRGGVFEMSDANAKLAVKAGGAIASLTASAARLASIGYECPACGFGSYFRTCSRCGGECVRG